MWPPNWANSAPGGTRTPDPRIRSPTLYPSELRAQVLRSQPWTGARVRSSCGDLSPSSQECCTLSGHRHGSAQALSVGGSEVLASPATRCQNRADPDHGRFRPRPDAGRPRGRDAGRRSRTAAPTTTTAPAPAFKGSGLRRKARIRPMPTETGSRPIHQGNGAPVFGMCPGPAACGGTPPAGAVGAPDGATAPAEGGTAPAEGPTAPAEGPTAPGLGVVGTGEGLAEPPLGAWVDGEGEVTPRLGPDGWWLERSTSKTTPRNRSTAMIAATGRKDWVAAPPRRAIPASCLSSCRSECSKAKLHSCGYSSKLQPRAFCSRVAVRCQSTDFARSDLPVRRQVRRRVADDVVEVVHPDVLVGRVDRGVRPGDAGGRTDRDPKQPGHRVHRPRGGHQPPD